MRRLAALAAVLCWTVILCAMLAVAGQGTAVGGNSLLVLGLVAALAALVTLGIAFAPLPAPVSYLAIHLIGAVVVVAVVEGPRPPWLWQPLPGIDALTAHGLIHVNGAALALLSVGLTWELCYACTWLAVRERRGWLALGVIVATLALLDPASGRGIFLPLLMLAGLALVLVTAAMERRRATPRRLRRRLLLRLTPLLLAPLACGLVAAAWAAPVPSPTTATALRELRWNEALQSLLARLGLTGGVVEDSAAGLADFGHMLRVGGHFNPGEAPVLEARVADLAGSPYWRGAVYDIYQGGAWRPVPARSVDEAAGAALPLPDGTMREAAVTQTITLLEPSDTLFTSGPPFSVSVSSIAALDGAALPAGVLRLRPQGGTLAGTYRAVSLPSAGTPISPAPVLAGAQRERDLRTPLLSARLRALAQHLIIGMSDPFSRAWAIQRYLRGAPFVYDTAPPQAPAGTDPAEYFLFSSHRGFCTQFATAMVLLSRLAGIPARLVTGYAAGHLTPRGTFLVTAADAHAWPELWIAGRGWLTFEPTPNFPTPGQAAVVAPAAATPGTSAVTATPAAGVSVGATQAASHPSPAITAPARATGAPATRRGLHFPSLHALSARLSPSILLAIAAVLVLFGVIVAVARARPDAATLYSRMCHLAVLLRAGPRAGQTPLEWAAAVAARAPDDGDSVYLIASHYARQRYGQHPPSPGELGAARAAWRALRRRWLIRLLARHPL